MQQYLNTSNKIAITHWVNYATNWVILHECVYYCQNDNYYCQNDNVAIRHHVFFSAHVCFSCVILSVVRSSSTMLFPAFRQQLSALEFVLTWDQVLGMTEQTETQLK